MYRLYFFLLWSYGLLAQKPLKYEFRAAWIATVNRIDWPSSKDSYDQKKEFIAILDTLQSLNFNTIIVQIRPSSDAFYACSQEPWSYWLSGEQGKAPYPYYDPLAFMIEEAHRRNMEIHAWFNPLRAVGHVRFSSIGKNHISKKKPNWLIQHQNSMFLNPGIPEVRAYIVSIIEEVVAYYDIDGVHMDDYFYPYPQKDEILDDEQTYQAFRFAKESKAEWRRSNINQLIYGVHKAILRHKPRIKFGISPFAVWREKHKSEDGVDTKIGIATFDHMYADTRLWLEKKWIDYVIPQIYQNRSSRNAPYERLMCWWADNSFDRHLYIGHAAYRHLGEASYAWKRKDEIAAQIRLNRMQKEISGSAFYSAKHLITNQGNLYDTLKNMYRYYAFPPPMMWKDSLKPSAPSKLDVVLSKNYTYLQWKRSVSSDIKGYAVYKASDTTKLLEMSNLAVILKPDRFSWVDKPTEKEVYYAITAIDRNNNESLALYGKVSKEDIKNSKDPDSAELIELIRLVDYFIGRYR